MNIEGKGFLALDIVLADLVIRLDHLGGALGRGYRLDIGFGIGLEAAFQRLAFAAFVAGPALDVLLPLGLCRICHASLSRYDWIGAADQP